MLRRRVQPLFVYRLIHFLEQFVHLLAGDAHFAAHAAAGLLDRFLGGEIVGESLNRRGDRL